MAALAETETLVPTETDLITMAQAGDRQAMETLIERYEPFIESRTRPFFIRGMDRDDVIQLGRIGFWQAVQAYKPGTEMTFVGFAHLCIRREVVQMLVKLQRPKHVFANSAYSLDEQLTDDMTLMGAVANELAPDPEEIIIERADLRATLERIAAVFSPVERVVLESRIRGESYMDIAAKLGGTKRTVDNALQRIKKKLRRHFAERQAIEEAV